MRRLLWRMYSSSKGSAAQPFTPATDARRWKPNTNVARGVADVFGNEP